MSLSFSVGVRDFGCEFARASNDIQMVSRNINFRIILSGTYVTVRINMTKKIVYIYIAGGNQLGSENWLVGEKRSYFNEMPIILVIRVRWRHVRFYSFAVCPTLFLSQLKITQFDSAFPSFYCRIDLEQV